MRIDHRRSDALRLGQKSIESGIVLQCRQLQQITNTHDFPLPNRQPVGHDTCTTLLGKQSELEHEHTCVHPRRVCFISHGSIVA